MRNKNHKWLLELNRNQKNQNQQNDSDGLSSKQISDGHSLKGKTRMAKQKRNLVNRYQITIKEMTAMIIALPKWQREDTWTELYRIELICSILRNHDLPKFYFAKIIGSGNRYLIDGGHRYRTIKKFINNEFYICIDGMCVYYNKEELDSNSRNLTEIERGYFDNYELSFTEYIDIEEKEARDIFNKLQNHCPMSIPDMINSMETHLIDYLRDLYNFPIDGQHLCHYFTILPTLPNPTTTDGSKTNELLCCLVSLFSQFRPLDSGFQTPFINGSSSEKEMALYWHEPGYKGQPPLFRYAKNYIDSISLEEKKEFEDILTNVIRILHEQYKSNKKSKINLMYYFTLTHSIIWLPEFSVEKFYEFINHEVEYNNLISESKKHQNCDNIERSLLVKEKANKLLDNYPDFQELNRDPRYDERYDNIFQLWKKSIKHSSGKGMYERLTIMQKYCLN